MAAHSLPSDGHDAEERRIRAAYARRPADDARYSWFDPAYVAAMQEIERAMLHVLAHRLPVPLADARVLEVGCGRGAWLQRLVSWGLRPEHVSGIDLLAERVFEARRTCAPRVDVRCGSAAALPWDDGAFDVVLQVTALSSILDRAVRTRVAAEMRRVARPSGVIVSYDFRVGNPRNPDVRAIGRRELTRLFPACRIALTSLTLAPPIARRITAPAPGLATALGAVPWLRSHYLAVIEAHPTRA